MLMFFNASLWLSWGIFLPMPSAVPANAFNLVVSIFYLSICWGCALTTKIAVPEWGQNAAGATLGSIMLAMILAGYATLSATTADHVGYLAAFICICMFSAPLSVLARVLQDKSSELLPPLQCSMQFFNCAFWLIVGFNNGSQQIIVCNSLGGLLATVQLSLIAIFP